MPLSKTYRINPECDNIIKHCRYNVNIPVGHHKTGSIHLFRLHRTQPSSMTPLRSGELEAHSCGCTKLT